MSPKASDIADRPDMVLDIERLTKNCSGNHAIVAELLRHLVQVSGPKWILALEQKLEAGDSEGVRDVCHGMKGACATVFAWRLSKLALEFENLSRDGDLETLAGRMGELRQGVVDVEHWIDGNL